MINRFKRLPRFSLAILFALTFVVAESAAFAHELQHDLRQHDSPSCVLHLYADHFGKISAAIVFSVPIVALTEAPALPIVASGLPYRAAAYRSRAPPLSS